MSFTRHGFTLANGPDEYGQTSSLVDAVNKLLSAFGLQPLASDTTPDNLEERLTELANYVDQHKRTTSTMAMANRLRGRAGQPAAYKPPTDAEIAARLVVRGIDPKYMPRTDR